MYIDNHTEATKMSAADGKHVFHEFSASGDRRRKNKCQHIR